MLDGMRPIPLRPDPGALVTRNVNALVRGATSKAMVRLDPREGEHLHPEKFKDHYENALKDLLEKKQSGQKIEAPREAAPAKVINLMDALRRSVQAEGGGEDRRTGRQAAARRRAPKKAARSSARKTAS
jgi:hypothetical protein